MAGHHHTPLRIGLTGGAASGKSTVAACFARLGVPVLSADDTARELTAPGTPMLESIRARFGPGVTRADGGLDRAALRERVFDDDIARGDLERMLHPEIRARLHAEAAAAVGPYVVLEIPLLRPQDVGTLVDRVLVVDLQEALQLERIEARDGIDEPLARRIMASQPSRTERLAMADDVIDNGGSEADVTDAVERLHSRYLEIARSGVRQPGLR